MSYTYQYKQEREATKMNDNHVSRDTLQKIAQRIAKGQRAAGDLLDLTDDTLWLGYLKAMRDVMGMLSDPDMNENYLTVIGEMRIRSCDWDDLADFLKIKREAE
jgi:hypothetical protein